MAAATVPTHPLLAGVDALLDGRGGQPGFLAERRRRAAASLRGARPAHPCGGRSGASPGCSTSERTGGSWPSALRRCRRFRAPCSPTATAWWSWTVGSCPSCRSWRGCPMVSSRAASRTRPLAAPSWSSRTWRGTPPSTGHPFVALNTAQFRDGVLLWVAARHGPGPADRARRRRQPARPAHGRPTAGPDRPRALEPGGRGPPLVRRQRRHLHLCGHRDRARGRARRSTTTP